MHKVKIFLFPWVICLLIQPIDLFASTTDVETNWYQVEILIFKNLEAAAITEEHWPHSFKYQYPSEIDQLKNDNEFVNAAQVDILLDFSASTLPKLQMQSLIKKQDFRLKSFYEKNLQPPNLKSKQRLNICLLYTSDAADE